MGNIIREKSQQKHAESTWCRLVPNLDPLTVGMVKKETTASGGGDPSPSDNAVLCAAVHQFLTGVDPKLAKMFKYKNHKINKDLSSDVPEDLPSLGQIVASYQNKKILRGRCSSSQSQEV